MSHVIEQEPDNADQAIRDLFVLKKACERCGLEFREGQTTFHNWATDHGKLVGDWPLPEGRTSEDVGKCTHAIGIPVNQQAGAGAYANYEIGVVESQKFPGTYSLMYDFWGGTLEGKVGKRCENLLMYYQVEAAKLAAQESGHEWVEESLPDGTVFGKAIVPETKVGVGFNV
jgi:hypothetical protein